MNRYTLAVLVRNQFGVLNRLTSMFRRRQFNISSITASETESGEYSRITFSFDGEENGKVQLVNQLYKLPDVCSIKELTANNSLSCEPILISTIGKGASFSCWQAKRIVSGSLPKICAAQIPSYSSVYNNSCVFSLPYFKPFALTISL